MGIHRQSPYHTLSAMCLHVKMAVLIKQFISLHYQNNFFHEQNTVPLRTWNKEISQ